MRSQEAPTFLYEVLPSERLIVGCRGERDVTDAEWAAYVAAVQELHSRGSSHRSLVYTERPMTRRQQQQLVAATGANQGRVAVLSDAIAVRFVVSMFNLLNRNVRSFLPSQLSEALLHLSCTTEEAGAVEVVYESLRARLSVAQGAPRPAAP